MKQLRKTISIYLNDPIKYAEQVFRIVPYIDNIVIINKGKEVIRNGAYFAIIEESIMDLLVWNEQVQNRRCTILRLPVRVQYQQP